MANEWGCAVLLHYYALPGFQNINGTMMAAFIPAEDPRRAPTPPASQQQLVIDGLS